MNIRPLTSYVISVPYREVTRHVLASTPKTLVATKWHLSDIWATSSVTAPD